MSIDDFLTLLKIMGPAVAVYVGIRIDMSAFHVRLDHLERDLYSDRNDRRKAS